MFNGKAGKLRIYIIISLYNKCILYFINKNIFIDKIK